MIFMEIYFQCVTCYFFYKKKKKRPTYNICEKRIKILFEFVFFFFIILFFLLLLISGNNNNIIIITVILFYCYQCYLSSCYPAHWALHWRHGDHVVTLAAPVVRVLNVSDNGTGTAIQCTIGRRSFLEHRKMSVCGISRHKICITSQLLLL